MFKVGEIKDRIGVPSPDVQVIRFENAKRVLSQKLETLQARGYSQGVLKGGL
jgi:hypothetical protein